MTKEYLIHCMYVYNYVGMWCLYSLQHNVYTHAVHSVCVCVYVLHTYTVDNSGLFNFVWSEPISTVKTEIATYIRTMHR